MKTFTIIFLIFSIILFFAFFGVIVVLILPWNDGPDNEIVHLNKFDSFKNNDNTKNIENDIRRKPINPSILLSTTINPLDAVVIKKIVESGILDSSSITKESTPTPETTTISTTTKTTISPETTITTILTTQTSTKLSTTTMTTTSEINTTPSLTSKTTNENKETILTTTYQPSSRRRHRLREKAVTIMLSNSLLKKFLKSENNFGDILQTLPPIVDSTTPTQTSFSQNPVIKDETNLPIDFSELSKVGVSKIEQLESPFEALQRSMKEKTSTTPINRISLSPVTLPTIETTSQQYTKKVHQLNILQSLSSPIIVLPSNLLNNEEEIMTTTEVPSTTILTTQLPLRSTSPQTKNVTSMIKNLPNKSRHIPLILLSTIESPSNSKPGGLIIVDDILFLAKSFGTIEIYNKSSLEYLGDIKTNLTINQINILSDDTLIISDSFNKTLNLIDFNGDVIKRLPLTYNNKGINVNQDMIFVLPSTDNEIIIYNSDLTLYKNIQFSNDLKESCNFIAPTSQYIYLACESHIKKLNYDGELIKELGKGKGTYIYNIKYDYRTNILYAIEKNESSIHVFNEDTGEHYKLFDEDITITLYNDIVLDDDKLYASDYQNNLVKIFTFDSYLMEES
ncbi:Six-bladed beta-propeller, TolB-like domain-containing protein [Strongyloides ratti]|uniref:Six-bladed beta-propeller, TolB-like domain-containing protein n=1 Tax=Strongyloides ratti TaxID=34506 RepID=A0A090L8H5_STRRB|nr:Six-bladed beta-propeller, TolB-like domain-containing protein [Strongyloides ratti]CEF66081.1 Six-bladed beta-propeller, TolB-like domain-containing protein [Strongyloides ratti]